jgi:putative transposase
VGGGVTVCAARRLDLERALRHWRKRRAGRPRFRRKKVLPDNAARFTGSIRVPSRHVQLSRVGKVGRKELTDRLVTLVAEGKARILSATVVREEGRWYVSLTCAVDRPDPPTRQGEPVGVDLGLIWFIVLSDRTPVDAPRPLVRTRGLLCRRSQQLSRKQKGSRNYAKMVLCLARLGYIVGFGTSGETSCTRSPRSWRKARGVLWWRTR